MSEVSEQGVLPLSSLRLLVPPLQLVSAALWGVVQQRAVMHYGLLEDFITAALDNIPELLTYTDRVQLVIGLRAKVVLEMCQNDDLCYRQNIEPHLKKIDTYIKGQGEEGSSAKVKASVANFSKVVHTLLDDPYERDMFYQKTFPTVFGPKFDSALQALVRKFLLNLQKLLPVPTLDQTSLWLGLSTSTLKECMDILSQPEPLSKLIQHHKHRHKVTPQGPFVDDCIFSSLSGEPLIPDNDKDTDVFEIKTTQHKSSAIDEEEKQNVETVTEDDAPSVEVMLPFDDTDSHKYKKDTKHLYMRQSSRKTFRCLVCGQNFGSFLKLKRHSISGCSADTVAKNRIRSLNLNFKTISKTGNHAWRKEKHLSTEHSLPSLENVHNDNLVCRLCGQVYTYEKNFRKHQKVCVGRRQQERREQETEPEPQSSTSSCQVKPEPSDNTAMSVCSEVDSEPRESIQQSIYSEEQMCKRSSRIKTCSICGQVFTSSTDVMSHMRCHTEESPYICGECGKDFDNYEDYKSHQENECKASKEHPTDVDLTQGMHCGQKDFKNIIVGPRRKPQNRVISQKACKFIFTCEECGQSFIYSKSFEKHKSKCFQKHPQKNRPIILNHSNSILIEACNFHSLPSASKNTDSEHKVDQTSEESENTTQTEHYSMKCTLCDKTFYELVLMKRHYSILHKIKGPYPCPVCKRTFVRLCELVKHHQRKQLFQCVTCKKCFTKLSLLSDHEKIHRNTCATPHVCETCGRSCKTAALLNQHRNKHKGEETTVCSYCGKQFSTKYCLQAHMIRHTSGFSCPICAKVFFQKTYLKWHMYKHTGQDPYLCETCGKGWPTQTQLKIHMIEHTQERPFKCEECGVSYKRESHLKAHFRAKHMSVRPFVCSVCSKAFRLNGQLKKHMMVHTGDRPFICSRCGKTFTRKCRLREHRETGCL